MDFMNQGQDLRIWTPGADAEEMIFHVCNCSNVRLLGEPYFEILIQNFLENTFATKLSLSPTPNKDFPRVRYMQITNYISLLKRRLNKRENYERLFIEARIFSA